MSSFADYLCDCTPPYLGPSLLDVCPGSAFLAFMTIVEVVIRDTCTISELCDRITPTLTPQEEYDFVVIGSGSGGATVAGRLAEVSEWTTLLLEAGIDEPPATEVPMYTNVFVNDEYVDWHYKTEPELQACLGSPEQRCDWPRAKMLGGCSSTNGMMHMRGTPADFDGWEAAGNEGWGYEEVLKWFKYSEDNLDVDTIVSPYYHGTGGKVTVSRFNDQPDMIWDMLKAAEEVGFSVTDDIDGANFTGFAVAQASNRSTYGMLMTGKNTETGPCLVELMNGVAGHLWNNQCNAMPVGALVRGEVGFGYSKSIYNGGARLSTARAFLRPVRDNPNFNVMLNSTATKILISDDGEKKTVTGVEFVYNNETYTVKVKKEVILAAGAINTPQVLLLSGVGPKDVLDEVGIEQVHELPGVGVNLTNHVAFGLIYRLNNVTNTNILNLETLADYAMHGTGPLSSTGMSQLTARLSSSYADPSGLDPDIQFLFGGYTQMCSQNNSADAPPDPSEPDAKRTIVIAPVNIQPKSRGYISLRSSDPFEAPIMVGNYLTHPDDIEVLLEAIRFAQQLASSETLVSKYGIEFQIQIYGNCSEEYEYDSDDYWRCCIRHTTAPENHQGSSCRMGPSSDEFAVVDNNLRVYGIDTLRIADSSVMPKLISGNPHATIVMIAERAVDFIKSTWL